MVSDSVTCNPKTLMARRRRSGLIGPLASWDLLRLARRGHTMRARFLLAGGLLMALTGLTVLHFRHESLRELFLGTAQAVTIQESAEFGNSFTLTVIFAQLVVLFLLTPAYAAGAIAEEKERHTFTLLLVSDLTGWEIFAGLLVGRVTFLLGVMLAGLPVLALALLYGGVSLQYVAMCYLITATTVVLLAAVGAAGAAATDTYRGALLRGYFLAVVVATGAATVFLSPFFVLGTLYHLQASSPEAFVTWGLIYAGGQLVAALVATVIGVRWVRQMRAKPVRRSTPPAGVSRTDRRSAPRRRPRDPDRRPALYNWRPPVSGRDPFGWKERYTLGTKRTLDDDSLRGTMQAVGLVLALIVGSLLLIAVGAALSAVAGNNQGYSTASGLLVTAGVLGYLPYLIVVGATAGRSVIVERQRNTLESLLAIPTDRGNILRPKWRRAVNTGLAWGLPSGLCLPLGLVLTEAPEAAVPSLVLVLAGGLLAASVGVWLSLRCRTATRALMLWLPVAGLLAVTQLLLYRLAEEGWQVIVAATVLAVGVALAAWLFWSAAATAFERYGRD